MDNIKEILKKIDSGEEAEIEEAIQAVREKGDMGVAEALLQHMESVGDKHTLTIIVSLLADIKENAFREIVVRHLASTGRNDIRCELLRIIWESALDYSAYLDTFMQLLQDEDFALAFEASTLIENMVTHLNGEQMTHLKDLISAFPPEKKFLVENIAIEVEDCDQEVSAFGEGSPDECYVEGMETHKHAGVFKDHRS